MTKHDPHLELLAAQALCREELFFFVWKVFVTLHPGQDKDYVPAWHVQAMCYELEKLYSGENTRLVITIPPRHLKSITVAVSFAAWYLGHHPEKKLLVASYSLGLGRKHSEDTRRIMEAPWYKALFPATRLASRGNTQDEFRTTAGGGRKAVSVTGAVTGFGADIIIIDDLLNASDASSETELENARNFVEGSLLSRFDKPSEGRVVLIAQRLHEADPAGHLLDKGTYRHLNMPAIAEEDEDIAIGAGRAHRRETGTALCPDHMDLDALERQRTEMGSATFNCQYQQNPIAPDGSALRWEWFETIEEVHPRERYQTVFQSWDTGMSADPKSDFSVCTTWGFHERKWHLLDVYRAQLDYPDLLKATKRLAGVWQADCVLIEKAASGIPLLQDCRLESGALYRAIVPDQNKEVRFNAALAPVEAGDIVLPAEAAWLPAFKRELQSFPRGRYDDQVDSFSQFLKCIKSRGCRRFQRSQSGRGLVRRDVRRREARRR